METGVPEALARDMLRIKRWFAFDNIRRTEDLLDLRIVDSPAVELRERAFVRRRGFNRYEFIYKGDAGDRGPEPRGDRRLPAHLPAGRRSACGASTSPSSTSAKGTGGTSPAPAWAASSASRAGSTSSTRDRASALPHRPGRQRQRDGGNFPHPRARRPFRRASRPSPGRTTASLLRHAPVRASVVKKYAALTGRAEATFYHYFEPHDLVLETWNRLDGGLEVMPVFSPHPVETTVFFFRALLGEGLPHLRAPCRHQLLRSAEEDGHGGPEEERHLPGGSMTRCTAKLLAPVDVKKIDIGGGLIHGKAEDFASDGSGKRLLSHTSSPLTEDQKKIGSAPRSARKTCSSRPNTTRRGWKRRGSSCAISRAGHAGRPGNVRRLPLIHFTPGTIMQTADIPGANVFLLVSGIVHGGNREDGPHATLSAGSLLGELEALHDQSPSGMCWAASHVTALRIPREAWMDLLRAAACIETLQEARATAGVPPEHVALRRDGLLPAAEPDRRGSWSTAW